MNYALNKEDINLLDAYKSILNPSLELKTKKALNRQFLEIFVNCIYDEIGGTSNQKNNPQKIEYITKTMKIVPVKFYNSLLYNLSEGNQYGQHSKKEDKSLAGMDNEVALIKNINEFIKWFFYSYRSYDPEKFNIYDEIVKQIERKKLEPKNHLDEETIKNAMNFRKTNSKIQIKIITTIICLIIVLIMIFIISTYDKEEKRSTPTIINTIYADSNKINKILHLPQSIISSGHKIQPYKKPKKEKSQPTLKDNISKEEKEINLEKSTTQNNYFGNIKNQFNFSGGNNAIIIPDKKDSIND